MQSMMASQLFRCCKQRCRTRWCKAMFQAISSLETPQCYDSLFYGRSYDNFVPAICHLIQPSHQPCITTGYRLPRRATNVANGRAHAGQPGSQFWRNLPQAPKYMTDPITKCRCRGGRRDPRRTKSCGLKAGCHVSFGRLICPKVLRRQLGQLDTLAPGSETPKWTD